MTQSAAIVGIGCRFPGGANSPEAFWQLLRDGVEAVGEVPSDRYDVDSVFDPDPARKGTMYTRRGGFVDDIDRFDAAFFGFSPREASRVDPQHRLLLEIAYEALEDAGLSADQAAGSRTGVFVGFSAHDYSSIQMYPFNRHLIDSHSMTGGASSIAANRISYMLDLRGPSFIVDTACSSALTAVHLAMRSLRNGECDLALAGGAQLNLTPEISIGFCKASMISPDGRCHAFDARANGYVRGEGGGLVLLKPLDAAVADGDRIYAVLVGTGINQDGGVGGMTVPSAEAQEEMLRTGLADAGLEPDAIQYAEAHGTGTPVGDPIEAAALGAVFGHAGSNGGRFPIGSVKTNIGHLEAGAGAAGLIKSALALHHGEIPPSLNFEEPSPDIDFDALALRVVTELEPWPSNGGVPAATINSFGFGGANANAVLQAAPRVEASVDSTPEQTAPYLLPISARSPEAQNELAALYGERLQGADQDTYLSICRAAARRRAHHDIRLAVVAGTAEEASEALGAVVAGQRSPSAATGRRKAAGPPPLAFVFSGMGPQWWAMGRQLAAEEPVFANALARCDEIFEPLSGWSLRAELQRDEADSRMDKADVAQVTNVAVQIALADLWASGESHRMPSSGTASARSRPRTWPARSRSRTPCSSPTTEAGSRPRPPGRARCSPPGSRRPKRRRCWQISTEPSRWRPSTLPRP